MAANPNGSLWQRHPTAIIVGALIAAATVYFIGVALFDNSTENFARERAARENFPPGLTEAETQYARQTLSYGRPETTLPVGNQWCNYFRNDPNPGRTSDWGQANDPSTGLPTKDANAMYNSAAQWLCPDDYRTWVDNFPKPIADPDYDPPPGEDRDWGPRG